MSKKSSKPTVQYTQEALLMRRKRWHIGLLIAGVLIVVCVIGLIWDSTRVVTGGIGGTYVCQLTEDETTQFYLELDADHGTYISSMTGEHLGDGTYRVSGERLTLRQSSGKKTYDIVDNYLLETDHYYQGTIPDGDTFEASISQDLETNHITLDFAADGTYTSTLRIDGTEEPVVTQGTYTREGDLLCRTRIDEDGSQASVPRLLVLDGQVNSSFYEKAQAEDLELNP